MSRIWQSRRATVRENLLDVVVVGRVLAVPMMAMGFLVVGIGRDMIVGLGDHYNSPTVRCGILQWWSLTLTSLLG